MVLDLAAGIQVGVQGGGCSRQEQRGPGELDGLEEGLQLGERHKS